MSRIACIATVQRSLFARHTPPCSPPTFVNFCRPKPLQTSCQLNSRTRSVMATQSAKGAPAGGDGVRLVNKLNESRSPYVRGHMNNPVAWQMWNAETLALAKQTNRLLFVSIGYAACHWCHVMERESFENQDIANILNSSFIPVKIDREERPDIDRIYMNYVQATQGSGGWPLNVFITPDLEPIFGGTYFPGPGSTSPAAGHVGFQDILEKIGDIWRNQQQRCLESAKDITAQLKTFAEEGTISRTGGPDDAADGLDLELLDDSYEYYKRKFDEVDAGFGGAPKFPTPVNLSFLLRLGQYPQAVEDVVGSEDIENAQQMVIRTLKNMARGGIHDQIGNGFARYSVTRDWSLPHFEKMLYDQAQLLPVYLDAYILTKDPELLDAVNDIATYLTSPPMHSSTGGFFSAEDADSYYRPNDKEKREGAFYVWSLKEFREILGGRDGDICARYYNVQADGNVSPEHDAHDELLNQNVLAITSNPEALSKEFGLSIEDIIKTIATGRSRLLAHRNTERPRPALDDKIVVAWNGLAIGALARTAAILDSIDPASATKYLSAALAAAAFIKKELFDPSSGTLKRVFRDGPGDAPGFADDYAFLISGLLDLYEATFDDAHLAWAHALQTTQLRLFWDEQAYGFFSTAADAPDLLLRLKDGLDNAEPSTNGVSSANLYRLASLLDDEELARRARQTVEAFEAEVMQHPFLFSSLMGSIVAGKLGVRSVVVCGEGADVEEAVVKWRNRVSGIGSLVRLAKGKGEWLRGHNALLKSMDLEKKRVMICEAGVCREELDLGDLERAVRDLR